MSRANTPYTQQNDRQRGGRGLLVAVIVLALILAAGIAAAVLVLSGTIKLPGDDSQTVYMEDLGQQADSEVEVEQEQQPVQVDILFVGDVLMHEAVMASGVTGDGSRNYDPIFANTRDVISAADVAIVDQETPLGGEELGLSGYPLFNSPTQVGDAEVNAGFDVIAAATNHTIDRGAQGVANALAFWRNNHPEIAVIGIADSQETYDHIYVYEKDGFKIAILNYTYGTNGLDIPAENPYAPILLDEDKVSRDVALAHEMADMVVVCPHWGEEYMLEPSEYQRYWADYLNGLGVDVILGAHTHCLEPIEVITGESGHQTLVYWSVGNFISNQGEPLRVTGGMARVTLVKDADGCHIANYDLVPVVSHQEEGYGGYTTYLLSDYTDELAARGKEQVPSKQAIHDHLRTVFGDAYDAENCIVHGGAVN